MQFGVCDKIVMLDYITSMVGSPVQRYSIDIERRFSNEYNYSHDKLI